MLSITVENPYYVIDSIEELDNRSDIEPMLFIPRANLQTLEVIF